MEKKQQLMTRIQLKQMTKVSEKVSFDKTSLSRHFESWYINDVIGTTIRVSRVLGNKRTSNNDNHLRKLTRCHSRGEKHLSCTISNLQFLKTITNPSEVSRKIYIYIYNYWFY